MATYEPLDIDALLAPLTGEHPAGESVPFSLRTELEEARKEIDPADFAADDPLRPGEAKKADWLGIIRTTRRTLSTSSKDLLIAARLTEALTRQYGFAGLADGIVLMRRMIEECWDRLYPDIDDGDLEVRAGPFNWLGDDGRGARFPHSLRTVPLFQSDAGPVSLRDVHLARDGKGTITQEQIDRATVSASREHCQTLVDELTRVLTELTTLNGVLNDKLSGAAPGMIDVRKVLEETLALVRQILQRKVPAEIESPAEAPSSQDQSGAVVMGSAKAVANREDVYRRLIEAADVLQRLEPHSPVPYLIRRCVELGSLPFPELMKALIRPDFAQALTEMNRELGIKEPG